MLRFEASDMVLLGPNKMPTVKLSVFGDSFMFNMIRHMVGMAVAVARGALPASCVEPSLATASLCACGPRHKLPCSTALRQSCLWRRATTGVSPVASCAVPPRSSCFAVRECSGPPGAADHGVQHHAGGGANACAPECRVPLAPPHTLVLSANEFRRFRENAGVPSPAVRASGDALALRSSGAAARDAFVATTLADRIGTLVDPSLACWRSWAAALDATVLDQRSVDAWQERHAAWAAWVASKRAERAARIAAEAQVACEEPAPSSDADPSR
jgi:hypothetical protein